MPYIDTMARERIDSGGKPENVGELTYVIYKACRDYSTSKPLRYSTYAEVISALENSKLEFYTRWVRPYEHAKIQENGDV